MKQKRERGGVGYDAVVIGGGPGGSSASTFLAKKGYRVLLLEKERFPRFHVGESLVPKCEDLLWELGADEKIARGGFQVKRGGNLTSHSGAYVKFHLSLIEDQLRRPYTYQVLRSEFDRILLDHSREHGVEVREEVRVTDILRDQQRVVGVTYARSGQPECELTVPIVIDASGRDTFLASKFRLRRKDPRLNKVSIWGHFDGVVREPGPDEGNLVAALFAEGWFWYIPLAGGPVSIGAVVDADTIKGRRRSPEAFFWCFVEGCPFVADRMKEAKPLTPLYVVSNLAYRAARFFGDGYILVGDAAIFLDPIYSYGVYLALKSGRMAAEKIDEAFRTGDFSAEHFRPYEESIRKEVEVVFSQIYGWYRFIGDRDRADRLIPLMVRWVSLRRSFSLLFSGMYDQLDPDGPAAMIQLLKNPLARAREKAGIA